jgi:hypothetical protein
MRMSLNLHQSPTQYMAMNCTECNQPMSSPEDALRHVDQVNNTTVVTGKSSAEQGYTRNFCTKCHKFYYRVENVNPHEVLAATDFLGNPHSDETAHLRNDQRLINSIELADYAHFNVFRDGLDAKGNKVPYIEHCKQVFLYVVETPWGPGIAEQIIPIGCACWLHDAWEDAPTKVNPGMIREVAGELTMELCLELTNPPKSGKSREEYFEYKLRHFAKMSPLAQLIKVYDRVANLSDFALIKGREEWKKRYIWEAEEMRKVLTLAPSSALHFLECAIRISKRTLTS